jgi:hypothetical protein
MTVEVHVRDRVTATWWRALERAGIQSPRERWRKQPRVVRQTVPVAAVFVLVLLVGLAWRNPDAALVAILFAVVVLRALPPRVRRYVLPVAALAAAIAYPFYFGKLFTVPILGVFPDVHTMVVMAVFVMMAIGLNMVVGYAGLLDLGYVAFYAIGAYTAAWFASPQFSGVTKTGAPARRVLFGAVGVGQGVGGIHFSIWLLLLVAGCLTALCGVIIGLPTLRLRGDYLAIVTLGFGEILPQVAGLRPHAVRAHRLTGELPQRERALGQHEQPLLLDRARPRRRDAVLFDQAARLATRARVDRHP